MTEIATNLWRLTHCPRCDYSLEGLMDTGICPECGEAYCQDFIVLRARPIIRGEDRNGLVATSPFGGILASAMGVALITASHLDSVYLLTLVAVLASTAVVRTMIWYSQPHRGQVLIWLGPQGLGQQSLVDPNSIAWWLQRASTLTARFLVPWLTVFACMCLFAPAFLHRQIGPRDTAIAFILSWPILGFFALLYLGQRRRVSFRPSGIRPGLLRWTAYKSIEIQPLGDGDYEFRSTRLPSTRKTEVVNIEIKATPPAIRALCDRIADWSQHRQIPVMKPPIVIHGARAARSAGLALRRIFVGKPKRERRENRV